MPVEPPKKRDLAFTVVADFQVDPERILAIGVGPGNAIACLARMPSNRPSQPGNGSALEVYVVESGGLRRFALAVVDLEPPFQVQPLADGGVIVAEVRSRNRPNAVVFDAQGQDRIGISIGDGIAEMLIDDFGALWVSYFDEGIAGGDPLSSAGLSEFDLTSGRLRWQFEPPRGSSPIEDCYALNVDADSVWVYHYPSFELVRIDRSRHMRRWATPIRGAHAAAISQGRVLFVGAYEDKTFAQSWRLGSTGLEDPAPLSLALPVSDPTPRFATRGASLYLLAPPVCYRSEPWS